MGSLHVAHPRLHQADPSVLDGMQRVVFEHAGLSTSTSDDPSHPVKPWASDLTTAELASLRTNLHCQFPNLSEAVIDQALRLYLDQPTVAAANQLAYETCESVGYLSRERIVEQAAAAHQIPTAYLETDAEIMHQRLQPSSASDAQSLRFAFSDAAKALVEDVVQALNHGDYDRVAALSDESLVGAGVDAQAFREVMVRQRNALWMTRLPALLDEGHVFILVGAAHLPGPDGLIARLQALGYRVSPVWLPAGSGTAAAVDGR
jgi:uncharacterized protein YbaP (TraB family)